MSELVKYQRYEDYEAAKSAALAGLYYRDGKLVAQTEPQATQPLRDTERRSHFKRNASIAVLASLAVGGYMGAAAGNAFISNRPFLEAANPAVVVHDTMDRVRDIQHGVDFAQGIVHFFGGN
jgi:hypothetical protein